MKNTKPTGSKGVEVALPRPFPQLLLKKKKLWIRSLLTDPVRGALEKIFPETFPPKNPPSKIPPPKKTFPSDKTDKKVSTEGPPSSTPTDSTTTHAKVPTPKNFVPWATILKTAREIEQAEIRLRKEKEGINKKIPTEGFLKKGKGGGGGTRNVSPSKRSHSSVSGNQTQLTFPPQKRTQVQGPTSQYSRFPPPHPRRTILLSVRFLSRGLSPP